MASPPTAAASERDCLPTLDAGQRQIRLLRLVACDRSEKVLHGELQVFALPNVRSEKAAVIDCSGLFPAGSGIDEAPSFIAFSYAWGDPSPLGSIHFRSGGCISVGQNAFNCLASFYENRQPRRQREDFELEAEEDISLNSLSGRSGDASTHWLWMDGVCIDQDSLVERNHQVGLMGDIYSSASAVISYLGPWEDVYSRVFENDRQIGFRSSEVADTRPIWENPYWTRLWIVQEVVLARRLVILLGSTAIPWSKIRKVGFVYGQSTHSRIRRLTFSRLSRIDWFTRERTGKKGRPLNEVSIHYEALKCSDPHDGIYALLSLSSSPPPVVDYSRPLEFLAMDVVLADFHGKRLKGSRIPHEVYHSLVETLFRRSTVKPDGSLMGTALNNIQKAVNRTVGAKYARFVEVNRELCWKCVSNELFSIVDEVSTGPPDWAYLTLK